MGPRPGPATATPRGGGRENTNFPGLYRPTFTNVYWNLNIKKNRAAQGGPPEPGAPCHGIIGILVNPALTLPLDDVTRGGPTILLPPSP